MKLIQFTLIVLIVFGYRGHALAYKEDTHAEMSLKAARQSILSTQDMLKILGLKSIDDPQQKFPNGDGKEKIIGDLIQDGARFEDAFPRSLHHFFDPLKDRALGFSAFTHRSPDWAIEDKTDYEDQEFSYHHARNYFHDALTARNNSDRDKNFGLLFQTLGQVIHHIQDMAQPQHVRIDAHCDITVCKPFGMFNPSRYESYTDEKRATGTLVQLFEGYLPINHKNDVNFLTKPRSFWHTEDKNPVIGMGISEFTNRSFVSAGTNFNTDRYPSPTIEGAITRNENANELFLETGIPVPPECQAPNPPCFMTFYSTQVNDNYRPIASGTNPRSSTESIFDQDLRANNLTPVFSLNRFNFDEAHKFLIPRAVAYSTGLIDYFFRGRLEAKDVEVTDAGFRLRVKNAIDPEKVPAWANEKLAANGQLTLAFEYQIPDAAAPGGLRKVVGASVPIVMSESAELPPGKTSERLYEFAVGKTPAQAKEAKYRLVYRGKLGSENDALAVGKVEPSGFLVVPGYIPADGLTGTRTIYRAGADWTLSSDLGKDAGSVDWKGWYVNGRPTKVLTWAGPASRYFPFAYNPNAADHLGRNGYLGAYGTSVYQNGERFAVAPFPVLGAALQRDSTGAEWLIVICRNGMSDIVYRRPNVKSDNTGTWQEIGRVTHDSAVLNPANMPWFFNGNGTAAQAMRSGWQQNKLWLYRLKVEISDAAANFSNEGNLDGAAIESTETMTCNYDPGGSCGTGESCGGTIRTTGDSKNELEIRSSGGFVVAVDYIDNEPVLATYSKGGLTKYTRTQATEQSAECVLSRDVCFGQFTGSRNIVHHEVLRDQTEKISLGNFGEIILTSTRSMLSTDFSDINSGSSSTKSGTGTSDGVTTIGQLRYLDLRYGLYSLRSTVTRAQGAAVSSEVIASAGQGFTVPHQMERNQTMGFLGQKFPFQVAPLPGVSEPVSLVPSWSATCDQTKIVPRTITGPYMVDMGQSVLYDPLYIDFNRRGNTQSIAVAVDSDKNLFISEAKFDNNSIKVGTFNYLTDGDPGIVIPVAPPDASYSIVRVIK